MALAFGAHVGSYEILSSLGAAGMPHPFVVKVDG